jgi:hypothetical protein
LGKSQTLERRAPFVPLAHIETRFSEEGESENLQLFCQRITYPCQPSLQAAKADKRLNLFFAIYGLPIVRKTVQWIIQRLQPSFSELHFRAAGLPVSVKKPQNTPLAKFEILGYRALRPSALAIFGQGGPHSE